MNHGRFIPTKRQVAELLSGQPLRQHSNGRPWMAVDVRDVAEAHVRLLTAPPVTADRPATASLPAAACACIRCADAGTFRTE